MNPNLLLALSLIVAAIAVAAFVIAFCKLEKQPKNGGKVMGLISFLDKVGADAKKDAVLVFGKILPVVAKAAQLSEPVIDLALPAVGPIYNEVVNAVVATEQGYAALNVQGTTEQKVAAVLSQVEQSLLPALQKAGLDPASANTVATNYINAIIAILSGPLSGGSTQAAPAAQPVTAQGPALVPAPAPAPVATVAAVADPAPAVAAVPAAPAASGETSGLAPA
jgi:hypothetical protein